MPSLRISSTVVVAFILWAAFIPVVLFVDRQVAYSLVNAVAASVAVGIVVGYSRDVWESLKLPVSELTAGDALQIGIFINWSAAAIIHTTLFWWRVTGKIDDSLIDSSLGLIGRYLLVTSGFLHLLAANSIEGRIPKVSYLRVGWWTAAGLLAGFGAIALAA